MKKSILLLSCILVVVFILFAFSNCSPINTVQDPHFSNDGTFIPDAEDSISFVSTVPNSIKFYVEVSGSMNGFFRANHPTSFKADVWEILSYYSPIINEVIPLTNDGVPGDLIPLDKFRNMMNTGAFVSSASTKVPTMIQSIIDDLNPNNGEVAVLVSDMKYSPVGDYAPDVLLTQYSSDISRILGEKQYAVCLIGATSDYLDKSGGVMFDKSPYYFFVIGNGPQVADIRNGISTLLENNHHFIDNIESGFNYGAPSYSFGIPDNCYQMDQDNPTFCGFDLSVSDTCTVKLKINLENYRWILTDKEIFSKALKVKALYGSNVAIGNVEIEEKNITDKTLKRTATAVVDLKVYDLALDSEVIEWTLELPDTDVTLFSPYLIEATSESDVTKSYSVENFIKGIFYGGLINKTLKPNYILISQNS